MDLASALLKLTLNLTRTLVVLHTFYASSIITGTAVGLAIR